MTNDEMFLDKIKILESDHYETKCRKWTLYKMYMENENRVNRALRSFDLNNDDETTNKIIAFLENIKK